MSFLPLFLQTADAASSMGVAGGGVLSLIPFVLIILIMYFLMIRPQSKKQKETQKMLDALKKGDKIITIGGIHGTVSSVKADVVTVKVDDNVKLDFNRTAIATVVTDTPAPKNDKKKDAEAEVATEEKNKESEGK